MEITTRSHGARALAQGRRLRVFGSWSATARRVSRGRIASAVGVLNLSTSGSPWNELMTVAPQSRSIIYRIHFDGMRDLMAYLLEVAAVDHASGRAPAREHGAAAVGQSEPEKHHETPASVAVRPRRVGNVFNSLFNVEPTVVKATAKWMSKIAIGTVDFDPEGDEAGLITSTRSTAKMGEVADRLQQADAPVLAQPDATCCYARSGKTGSTTRTGSLRTFYTHGDSPVYDDFVPTPGVRGVVVTSRKRKIPAANLSLKQDEAFA